MAKIKYPKLPKAFKNKWLKALRSGKIKQGKSYLKRPGENSYCCLGVAGKISGASNFGNCAFILPGRGIRGIKRIPDQLKGSDGLPEKLANMNDEGKSFKKIAAWIEKHL